MEHDYPSVPGPLFLMEDDRQDDERALRQISSYSWLSLLEDELLDARIGVLVDQNGEHAKRPRSSPKKSLDDPISVLTRLGARPSPARTITTLYRVRATCATHAGIVTVGYPIVIVEGNALTVA